MIYEEIMSISNVQEKQNKLKDYYINEIGVEDWLVEKSKEQKIRFKDRWEYRCDGIYHRLTGPAIEFHDGSRGFYYIHGVVLELEEWKKQSTHLLREYKLARTLK